MQHFIVVVGLLFTKTDTSLCSDDYRILNSINNSNHINDCVNNLAQKNEENNDKNKINKNKEDLKINEKNKNEIIEPEIKNENY